MLALSSRNALPCLSLLSSVIGVCTPVAVWAGWPEKEPLLDLGMWMGPGRDGTWAVLRREQTPKN